MVEISQNFVAFSEYMNFNTEKEEILSGQFVARSRNDFRMATFSQTKHHHMLLEKFRKEFFD